MNDEPKTPPNDETRAPWAEPADRLAARFAVDVQQGLDPAEVARRLREHGPNLLRQVEPTTWIELLARQFKSLIVLLLAAAAAVSLAFGDWLEAVAIGLVIAINAAIGLVTELRAVRSMEALQKLSRVRAKVRRAGQLVEVPAGGIVPGDVVVLEAGDTISADMRLLTASKLEADESALTGESLPVSKAAEPVDAGVPLAERRSMLFKGTSLTRGTGEGVVTATGMATELGRISALIEEAEEEATPLEKRLDRLGRMLLWATLAIAAAIAGIGIATGRDLLLMIETSIALAVAAIPEGLPIVATLALARGMWRMAKRNAVVRRLSAVETLGAASVICTDKTGTLTENRMSVAGYWLGTDAGEVDLSDPAVAVDSRIDLRRALEIGVLCNNAELAGDADEANAGRGVGDPLEVALLAAAAGAGVDPSDLRTRHPELREDAFDSDTKRMATFHETPSGEILVAAKGSPESIVAACTDVYDGDALAPLDDAGRERWLGEGRTMAAQGLRVLGLATKTAASVEEDAFEGLGLIGWVALADPARGDVRAAINTCQDAGIRVVMVTGDQPATARSIARAVGIVDDESAETVRGAEFAGRLDGDRSGLLDVPVFARVTPAQKLDLIALYQDDGRVVAMTGDGVNDAPALKKADIGVAMGLRGTQVAQEAADMVLKDDAFATIVDAVAQGRAIFDNIRKFVVYLLSCNVSEILAVAIASFAGIPLPLLPLQILFLNLVTDVFPALALGAGEGGGGVMRRPPRPADEPIVTRRHWVTVGGYGALIAGVVLGALLLCLHRFGFPAERATTVAFLGLAFAQLWHVFNMRDPGSGFTRNEITRNPYIWGALALCSGLLVAAVYVPGLSTVLKTVDPGPLGWAVALGASLVPWLVGQAAIGIGSASARA